MLVGREVELAELDRALARMLGGQGALVLVGGEPGAGKTALVAEAADRARAAGATVGWGVCPAVGAPPFLPWRRALRTAAPEAALLLEHSAGGGDDARFRLFAEVGDALGATLPTAVVLDDLQWADAASLQLLHFLARGLRGAPVLCSAPTATPSSVATMPCCRSSTSSPAPASRCTSVASASTRSAGSRRRSAPRPRTRQCCTPAPAVTRSSSSSCAPPPTTACRCPRWPSSGSASADRDRPPGRTAGRRRGDGRGVGTPAGRSDDVTLTMRRRGGGWVVVRTPGACLALGCP